MVMRDNTLLQRALEQLQTRLPKGWSVRETGQSLGAVTSPIAEIATPSLCAGRIVIESVHRLEPRDVPPLVALKRHVWGDVNLMVTAPYLSVSTRVGLRDREVSYLDLTGNVHIVLQEPGLFLETQGSDRDPYRGERPIRSLRGSKTGRIVRALIDSSQCQGVRELATRIRVSAGHVSRVLAFLDAEALIVRGSAGQLQNVDWLALLRRWAGDAHREPRRDTDTTYLCPRGAAAFLGRLRDGGCAYAVTGALAASIYAPVNPPSHLTVWVHDVRRCAEQFGLVTAQAEGNVRLLGATDDGVFEGAQIHEQCFYVSPTQAALDLLTSPGRGPAKAEVLLEWMRTHEPSWRRQPGA